MKDITLIQVTYFNYVKEILPKIYKDIINEKQPTDKDKLLYSGLLQMAIVLNVNKIAIDEYWIHKLASDLFILGNKSTKFFSDSKAKCICEEIFRNDINNNDIYYLLENILRYNKSKFENINFLIMMPLIATYQGPIFKYSYLQYECFDSYLIQFITGIQYKDNKVNMLYDTLGLISVLKHWIKIISLDYTKKGDEFIEYALDTIRQLAILHMAEVLKRNCRFMCIKKLCSTFIQNNLTQNSNALESLNIERPLMHRR